MKPNRLNLNIIKGYNYDKKSYYLNFCLIFQKKLAVFLEIKVNKKLGFIIVFSLYF